MLNLKPALTLRALVVTTIASAMTTGQCLAQAQTQAAEQPQAQQGYTEQGQTRQSPAEQTQTQQAKPQGRARWYDPPEQDLPQQVRAQEADPTPQRGLAADIKAYYTAPLRWNGTDWAYFGASLAAIGVAYHFDDQVRTHFVTTAPKKTKELPDAIPTAAAVAATWLYANLIDDSNGRSEAWQMVEAGGLSAATGFALKFAAGRSRPYETADRSAWRKGGNAFPSLHTTAAFAVGTVLAESGSDDYRWPRRFLGYGVAIGTGYLRLKHNAHWLSDTVAGAALGAATARFVMNRANVPDEYSGLMLVPTDGGVMLTYSKAFP